MKLPQNKILARKKALYDHPLFADGVIKSLDELHIFMEHHVFAVWDFMSLIKTLQHHVCPSTTCWVPTHNIRTGAARLVNEIILAEESDLDIDGKSSISHHDLYCQAMLEVGADANQLEEFVEQVRDLGFRDAIDSASVPPASAHFMRKTFQFIDSGEAHIVAAAFCFGRETIIPEMFTKLTKSLNISKLDCPKFHHYLERHIAVDGEEHGPASIELVESLCNHDPVHIHEAEQAALEAIDARIKLWDDVLNVIQNEKGTWRHN
ncbi:MAG: DUF3050 domain-containing protein [Bdellovibrionaceae bacterium]|nr:DUF3050 domain-containing protein [Pseudobdellovibrionaceae bacterium]